MTESKVFNRVSTTILTVMVTLTLLPILLIIIASFTEETSLLQNGYSFIPKAWSFDAYYYIIKQGSVILRAYGVSVLVTVAGTVLSVAITTTLAYPMARTSFRYRNVLSFFVFFTMLFSGGIVPSYIMWTNYFHIKNTIWALIVPNYLVSAFNVILVKNFYANNIPGSLIEAAQLDGATEMQIFRKLVFPMARPVVATISLFTGLCYWNDWTNGLYYIVQHQEYYSIQNVLTNMLNNVQFLKSSAQLQGINIELGTLPSVGIRMAIAVVAVVPIMIVYPFIQKSFVKGIVIGGVKG